VSSVEGGVARAAKNMKKQITVIALCAMLLALCVSAEAQQPTRVPRIGHLNAPSLSALAYRTEAFRKGLGQIGRIEGKNILIEWRSAEGKLDRLPELAAELVRLKVEIIVSTGPTVTRAAKEATSTIPIVMAFDPNPVGNGFVSSLARPGGNITGLSSLAPEISGKQLELLKELVPTLSRIAVFGTTTVPGSMQAFKALESAAGAFGVKLQFLDILARRDIESAFREANKGRAGAALVLTSAVLANHRPEIADLAIKSRLAVMYFRSEFVEDGGLIAYGVSVTDLDRRAATYVDKILRGAKPAGLPVEQPMKFEFIINLKAAKQIGLTIPPNVLARADRVIR